MRLIAVTGSRHYDNAALVEATLGLHVGAEDVVLTGDARGLDTIARHWAFYNKRRTTQFRADWDRHGLAAGPIRNGEMLAAADILIAFTDGAGKFTRNCIAQAKRKGIPVIEVTA